MAGLNASVSIRWTRSAEAAPLLPSTWNANRLGLLAEETADSVFTRAANSDTGSCRPAPHEDAGP